MCQSIRVPNQNHHRKSAERTPWLQCSRNNQWSSKGTIWQTFGKGCPLRSCDPRRGTSASVNKGNQVRRRSNLNCRCHTAFRMDTKNSFCLAVRSIFNHSNRSRRWGFSIWCIKSNSDSNEPSSSTKHKVRWASPSSFWFFTCGECPGNANQSNT